MGSVSGLPATTAEYGGVWIDNWAGGPGLMAIWWDGPTLRPPPEKPREMVPTAVSARLVKVATPPTSLAVAVPTSGPLPRLSAAVITVLLSGVSRFPYRSSSVITG